MVRPNNNNEQVNQVQQPLQQPQQQPGIIEFPRLERQQALPLYIIEDMWNENNNVNQNILFDMPIADVLNLLREPEPARNFTVNQPLQQ